MKPTQSVMDKFAIGLSIMCTIHCFTTPISLTLLPSLAALQLDSEQFHIWILAAVIPTSVLALSLGCKKHKRFRYMVSGLIGVILMVLAVTVGEWLFGELGEKGFTLVGAAFIAVAHWFNYCQCLAKDDEDCPCSANVSEQAH
ncbi:MerC domain-containing protein [Pseudoalteromonas ostreae]|uniref:MerC domain-containing protein n=1 Tax=Pseudoalteromonas ostreae TaxID=2774154 RepID=UPI001B38D379|nr:MerC domain-containing protein [Pseudoalteromonas ostreae]